MNRLISFLQARIEEDETAANTCLLPENLHPYGDESIPAIAPSEWRDLARNYLGGPMGEHCARWDPTRVLDECAAKRAIMNSFIYLENEPGRLTSPVQHATYTLIRSTVILPMAEAYSAHPDYRTLF